jgi:hypothetical protein
LRTKLDLISSDINHLGNFRFVGATDNIRKRSEMPASYFARLKCAGVDIEKHLLLKSFADDPSKLKFDVGEYETFRDKRFDRIWKIVSAAVNPEVRQDVPRKPAVLFVCLGNICRSPLAEAAFRAEVVRIGLDVEVDSAGIGERHWPRGYLGGSPIPGLGATALRP